MVTELMEGSDLFDYMKARKFKINEAKAKEISYQIV